MVVKIISADNTPVEFGKNEVQRIPYAMDIIESADEDTELPIVGIDTRSLLIIKEMLELQSTHGLPFKTESKEIQKLGTEIVYIPIYDSELWEKKEAYYDYLKSLTAEELVKAFVAADYMGCYDLRHGLGYIIAKEQVDYNTEVKKALKEHFSDRLFDTYTKLVVNNM